MVGVIVFVGVTVNVGVNEFVGVIVGVTVTVCDGVTVGVTVTQGAVAVTCALPLTSVIVNTSPLPSAFLI